MLTPEDELRTELLLRPELLHKPAHFEGGPYDGEIRAIAGLDGKKLGDTIRVGLNDATYTYEVVAVEPERYLLHIKP